MQMSSSRSDAFVSRVRNVASHSTLETNDATVSSANAAHTHTHTHAHTQTHNTMEPSRTKRGGVCFMNLHLHRAILTHGKSTQHLGFQPLIHPSSPTRQRRWEGAKKGKQINTSIKEFHEYINLFVSCYFFHLGPADVFV